MYFCRHSRPWYLPVHVSTSILAESTQKLYHSKENKILLGLWTVFGVSEVNRLREENFSQIKVRRVIRQIGAAGGNFLNLRTFRPRFSCMAPLKSLNWCKSVTLVLFSKLAPASRGHVKGAHPSMKNQACQFQPVDLHQLMVHDDKEWGGGGFSSLCPQFLRTWEN